MIASDSIDCSGKTLGHLFVFFSNFDRLGNDLNLQTLMILLSKARPFICFRIFLIYFDSFICIFSVKCLRLKHFLLGKVLGLFFCSF